MSKLDLFQMTYLGLNFLALPVLAFGLVSISDEGASPEIT